MSDITELRVPIPSGSTAVTVTISAGEYKQERTVPIPPGSAYVDVLSTGEHKQDPTKLEA